MRRKDREIKDANCIAAFIAKEQILRIAFYDEGDIYIVPPSIFTEPRPVVNMNLQRRRRK